MCRCSAGVCVPVPVPARVCVGGNGNGRADPVVTLADDASGGGEASEGLAEAFIADAQDFTEGVARKTAVASAVQGCEQVGVDVGAGGRSLVSLRLARDDG